MNETEALKELKRLNKQLEHLEKTHKTGIVSKDEFEKGKKRVEKRINKVESEVEKQKVMKEMLKHNPNAKKKTKVAQKTKSKTSLKNKKSPKSEKKAKSFDNFHDDFEENRVPWTFIGAVIVIFLIIFLYLKFFASGPLDDGVKIIEFSDFDCSHCAAAQETLNELEQIYGSDVEFTFKYFPMSEVGRLAAQAAECAAFQGKFWEYHDLLFENQDNLDKDSLFIYANQTDLDLEDFITCLDLETTLPTIEKDIEEGKEKGVKGTPTFFINGRMMVGAHPIDVFQAVIDQELE